MASITESIDVQVPVRTAYDQWTQFEEFPQFMDGVQSVDQVGDTNLHGDLERFKELIESRGVESGAWRGEVEGGERIR